MVGSETVYGKTALLVGFQPPITQANYATIVYGVMLMPRLYISLMTTQENTTLSRLYNSADSTHSVLLYFNKPLQATIASTYYYSPINPTSTPRRREHLDLSSNGYRAPCLSCSFRNATPRCWCAPHDGVW